MLREIWQFFKKNIFVDFGLNLMIVQILSNLVNFHMLIFV
jgi:hypothetical protein